MSNTNSGLAEAYYEEMGRKNIAGMEKYLHPDVQFMAPLAQLSGKEAVLEATQHLMERFKTLSIRATFGSNDQAMVVYSFDFLSPLGTIPSAALLTFQESLIKKIELFYDARPFVQQ